jgi:hypothetical protein
LANEGHAVDQRFGAEQRADLKLLPDTQAGKAVGTIEIGTERGVFLKSAPKRRKISAENQRSNADEQDTRQDWQYQPDDAEDKKDGDRNCGDQLPCKFCGLSNSHSAKNRSVDSEAFV